MQVSSQLDSIFAALADPTRRAILARLSRGEASVNELALPFPLSQPAISKHLAVLEKAGLISRGQDAQRRPRKLEAQPMAEAVQWLESFREYWEGNYRRLDTLLAQMQSKKPTKRKKHDRTRNPQRRRPR
jgi:DNA-binding transcriptional ArsR family regulator